MDGRFALHSAVEQSIWWNRRWQRQVHLHGMPLIGTNHRVVGVQCKAALVTRRNDRLEIRSGKRLAVISECMQKILDGSPAVLVEGYSDGSRLVTQDEAQEFRERLVLVGHLPRLWSTRGLGHV